MNRGIELTTKAAIDEYDKVVDKLKSNCMLYGMNSIKEPSDDASCDDVYSKAMLALLYSASNEINALISEIEK